MDFWKNKACSSHCDTCETSAKCTECSSSYYLYEDNCLSICPTKYFGDTSSTPHSCQSNHKRLFIHLFFLFFLNKFYPFLKNKACSSHCDKCESSTKCSECTNPYYLC